MKILIIQMQKVGNHVTKLLLIFLFSNSIYSQNNKAQDLIILKKVLVNHYKSDTDNFYIKDTAVFRMESLKKYYDFKHKGITNLKVIESTSDSIKYVDDVANKKYAETYFNRYEIISKYFNKKDLENILKENKFTYWTDFKLNQKLNLNSKSDKSEPVNISRPYYNKDKKAAMICISKVSGFDLLIFSYQKKDWIEVGNISNF